MLSQLIAITGINIKSIPERWGPSLVIVVGLAGVVAVFTALFAMAQGFASTLADRGRDDLALILRGGSSNSELNSALSRDAVTLTTQVPGIRRGADGKPEAAAELVIISELPKKGEPPAAKGKRQTGVNVSLRGVEEASFALRPHLRIVEGRKFQAGLREILVGRGVVNSFEGAAIGNVVRMRGSEWTVVGIFESGDAYESELWVDVGTAQTSFGRNGFSSVLAQLDGPDALDKIKAALAADPRLASDVTTQREYLGAQTKQFRAMIQTLGVFLVIVMGLGAIFAALNTMYAAVAARAREIATLRAIGFGSLPVLVSVMAEALLLSLVGGLIGAAIAYVLFNNVSLSTLGANFTQVVFAFKVTPALVLYGVIISLVIGLFGGLLPAARAARMPITTALREL
ncbi:ABC transporter permease [Tahibacter harae]|uniref:ABC transporter permease n=1 Tax=Tahibacter harae TaxID=2963937 RepID=A0ABT1QW75_9GAMM|nr:ABC transporter permease [Tahibacter harae]MCQ4166537.1 ABC transporter permease [Tahibacter harae]